MSLKTIATRTQLAQKVPLRLVLVVPFVLQIFAAVGLVGYFSLRNGQKAINDLATQLQTEVSDRIDQHLNSYLATPHQINQINADAMKLGLLNLQDFQGMGHYFWKQIQVFDVSYISLVLPTNEFIGAGYYKDPNHVDIEETSRIHKGKNYIYATDNQGNRTKLTFIEDYDPMAEDAYQAAVKAGKPVWSKVYPWNDAPDIISKGSVNFQVGVLTNSADLLDSLDMDAHPKTDYQVELDNEIDTGKIIKIRFQVEDTGVGMTPEQLDKIFLPFEQVGDSAYKAEGTGLGLAISHQIVEMMGSKIHVESIYGKGSKFWFDLDLIEATDLIKLEKNNFEPNIIGYQGEIRKILIVDDRWENRAVIVNLLQPINLEIIEANNGQNGLEKAQEFQPDVIITDLSMPVMDGFEMTQTLRNLAEFKNALIIASSASVFSLDRQKSREAGCNDFLAKPVQAIELFEQLQTYLGLEWIYETKDNSELVAESQETFIKVDEMVIPPSQELTNLYQAAKGGYVLRIIEEANRIKQLDSKYRVFANSILKLADEFDDEAIANLIQPFIL